MLTSSYSGQRAFIVLRFLPFGFSPFFFFFTLLVARAFRHRSSLSLSFFSLSSSSSFVSFFFFFLFFLNLLPAVCKQRLRTDQIFISHGFGPAIRLRNATTRAACFSFCAPFYSPSVNRSRLSPRSLFFLNFVPVVASRRFL